MALSRQTERDGARGQERDRDKGVETGPCERCLPVQHFCFCQHCGQDTKFPIAKDD